MKNSLQKKIWIIISCVSLGLNILFILPYWPIYSERAKYKLGLIDYAKQDTDSQLVHSVIEQAFQFGDDGFYYIYPEGLWDDVRNYLMASNKRPPYFAPEAYLFAGLSYQALENRDTSLVGKLEQQAQQMIHEDGTLNYKMEVCDQIPIGVMFINLYKITRNPKYDKTVRYIYKKLLDMRTKGDFIQYRNNSTAQYCDALGMIVPFLMEYHHLTGDTIAKRIAYYNMHDYHQYGVDKETGIPAHGYDLETKIKVGSINWGRGIGWYVLAAAYLPDFKDSLLDASLEKMEYTQFPMSSRKFDASTALPIEIYKHRKGFHNEKNLEFIKSLMREDGHVDSISGETRDFNDYSRLFGTSNLADGWFLMLTAGWYQCKNRSTAN